MSEIVESCSEIVSSKASQGTFQYRFGEPSSRLSAEQNKIKLYRSAIPNIRFNIDFSKTTIILRFMNYLLISTYQSYPIIKYSKLLKHIYHFL